MTPNFPKCFTFSFLKVLKCVELSWCMWGKVHPHCSLQDAFGCTLKPDVHMVTIRYRELEGHQSRTGTEQETGYTAIIRRVTINVIVE